MSANVEATAHPDCTVTFCFAKHEEDKGCATCERDRLRRERDAALRERDEWKAKHANLLGPTDHLLDTMRRLLDEGEERLRKALRERDEWKRLAEEAQRERDQGDEVILTTQAVARELLERLCLMAEERNPPVKASAFREPWERLYPWLRRTNGGD